MEKFNVKNFNLLEFTNDRPSMQTTKKKRLGKSILHYSRCVQPLSLASHPLCILCVMFLFLSLLFYTTLSIFLSLNFHPHIFCFTFFFMLRSLPSGNQPQSFQILNSIHRKEPNTTFIYSYEIDHPRLCFAYSA